LPKRNTPRFAQYLYLFVSLFVQCRKSDFAYGNILVMDSATVTGTRLRQLDELLGKLGISLGRMQLLEEALTHSSWSAENPGNQHNERLEFFGDPVLKFVVSEYLMERFPDYDEGQLSEIRSVLVSSKTLYEAGEKLGLGKYIKTGRRVSIKSSIVARSMEAILGAVYFDAGLFTVQNLIIRLLGAQATSVDRDETKENYKAALQEYTQARNQGVPVYKVVDTEGPAHSLKFTVAVSVGEVELGVGSGSSKKEAEQAAAKIAFTELAAQPQP
jgi:ribonuclease-3